MRKLNKFKPNIYYNTRRTVRHPGFGLFEIVTDCGVNTESYIKWWYEPTVVLYNTYMKEYITSPQFLYIALIAIFILSTIAQGKVQRTFNKYLQTTASSGITAERMAEEILLQNGVYTVGIEAVDGTLTDHYDPSTGVVGLSTQVYGSNSVSALAVTAHEIGHVMQHQEAYAALNIRNAILPVARISSTIAPLIVIFGAMFGFRPIVMIGAILFGAVLLFQLVTLPVELDASRRGLLYLEQGSYIDGEQKDQAREVLKAAAMTYVWATVASLISFLRLLSIGGSSRRSN